MSLIFLLGEDAISWLLNDQFSTNASAPLTTPRTAEPGPGVGQITDTGNKLSIASQKLTASAAAALNYIDPRIVYGAQTRSAGLAFFTDLSARDYPIAGFFGATTGTEANAVDGMSIGAANFFVERSGTPLVLGTVTPGTIYSFCVVVQSSGALCFVKGGSQFPTWTLVFADKLGNSATLYPTLCYGQGSGARTFDNVRVRQLPAPFTSHAALATLTQASPAYNTNYTGDADGVKLVTITPPGPMVATNELRYRYLDSNNYWVAYFDSAGAFKVDSVVSGTPTNRVNVAGVITATNTRTIAVVSKGTSHDFYTLNGATWTKRGITITVATPMDAATTVRLVIDAGGSAVDLQSYARTNAAWSAELDKV